MVQLPPKTCSIERLVTFRGDQNRVLNGEKTAARRNSRYADVGEVMTISNRHFEVTKVYRQALGDLTDQDARKEGFPNLSAYQKYITSLHPGMVWDPNAKVWTHEFVEVKEEK